MSLTNGVINTISIIAALISMILVLLIQWNIERETKERRLSLFFHIINVLVMLMFYSTSQLALYSSISTFKDHGGILRVLLEALILPIPVITIVYVLAAISYRSYVRPYVKVKGTNLVVLKRRRR
ncbi:hypothetical protein [Alkalihalobacterium alkalinitrilicum]|uniref:hypothetical protein n=1 Tax=Alkalihalobacterium alkalinitrilicum TaxID=427920 RepID=UPI000994BF6C|nr:hypothetical protein [Alkalihalobacterium alkalinitrilicum]